MSRQSSRDLALCGLAVACCLVSMLMWSSTSVTLPPPPPPSPSPVKAEVVTPVCRLANGTTLNYTGFSLYASDGIGYDGRIVDGDAVLEGSLMYYPALGRELQLSAFGHEFQIIERVVEQNECVHRFQMKGARRSLVMSFSRYTSATSFNHTTGPVSLCGYHYDGTSIRSEAMMDPTTRIGVVYRANASFNFLSGWGTIFPLEPGTKFAAVVVC